MKYLQINEELKISQLAAGCMRFSKATVEEMEKFVQACLTEGINFFDHADIYGDGACETLFGKVLEKHPE
jgi:predicted oxidoreductase